MTDHEKGEIRKEMDNLKALLGKLDKGKQIAKAVHYEASLRNSDQGGIKHQALSKYISNAGNGLHARLEMEIYRLMGETSKYFMRDQVLDLETLKQLAAVLEFWAFLAMGGALGTLVEHKHIQRVWSYGGSAAEVFRAFLDVQKAKRKFEKWTVEHIYEVNLIVHEVVEDYQRAEQDSKPSETPRTKKVTMEEKRKSSSQTQQAQAQSGKTRGDRSPQGPPTKKARLVESPSRQNEHAQSRRFKSSMSSVAKQNIEALHQGIRPKNIFDGPTPSPDKHFMDKAFDQINGSIQGLSSSSPPKKTHDSDTAKVQPLQLRKSDTLTPTQVKESSAKNLNIIKEIRESDSAQNLPADQSSKTEVPVRKFTADIWEVSDDESDTPEEEAAKEEMKLTVGDIFGACVSQIAKHLAGPQKVAEASTTSSHETSREETPVQRLTENLPKFETKFRTVEKAYKEAEATLEAVKSKANEAAKSLDGFETKTRNELDGILTLDRKVGERWTFEAIRSQAAAFQTFGFVKRRELLDVQVPIREEKDARKNFEQAEAEYEKRRKKMALLNQAAEAFDED